MVELLWQRLDKLEGKVDKLLAGYWKMTGIVTFIVLIVTTSFELYRIIKGY